MLRENLREIEKLLALTESETEVEIDTNEPDEADADDSGEQEFLQSVADALDGIRGQEFPTTVQGVSLQIQDVRRPIATTETEELEFVVPLFVQYVGKADASVWAAVEKTLEANIRDSIQTVASEFGEDELKVKLVKRTKTDPFKNDPRSLTMLRYRVF
jgi:hypothetical protein